MARNALAALQRLRKAETEKVVGTPPPAPLVAVPGFGETVEMTLEAFSTAGLVVRVTSRLLGEDVLFASDNAVNVDEEGALVVYRADELLRLVQLPQECIRTVHRVKKAFRGANVTEIRLEGEEGNG